MTFVVLIRINRSTFKAFEQPFPIVIADSVPPNPNPNEIIPGNVVPLNSEIWEFSPCKSLLGLRICNESPIIIFC